MRASPYRLTSSRPVPIRRFLGKYRGKVLDNLDPLELHRLIVDVPALAGLGPGLELSWALPCVPYGGMQVGFVALPPIGANVWVEFEGGDPTHPIWTGCFWSEGEKPAMAVDPFIKVFKTDAVTLIVNDTPGEGGVILEVGPPAVEVPVTITIDSAGIQVTTAEALVSMSPEEITATIPPTEVSLTEGTVSVETEGTVSVTADETTVACAEVTVTAAVAVTGDVEIAGAVEVEGDVEIAGAVEVEGDVEILGAVEVEGDVAVLGAVEIAGDLAVAGAVEVAGDLAAAVIEGVIIPVL
jgi:cytoskeletal protein CcmA (bactofilin family)